MPVMEKITQTAVAAYIGITGAYLCDIKRGKRRFSPKKAQEISRKTGISLEQLLFADGVNIYKALCLAYGMHKETMK